LTLSQCIVSIATSERAAPACNRQKAGKASLGRRAVIIGSHAAEEMAKDSMTDADIGNVINGGTAREGELRSNTWRYKIETRRFVVVVAFHRPDTPSEAVAIVTTWRLKG
jgi:hypothetical protein